MVAVQKKPRVLCVDDEPAVLEGLGLHLRRHYEVNTANSGPAGLEQLEKGPPVAVVLSDMRMPGMDGAAFLTRVRGMVPDTVRMLLTGHADVESSVAAVNEGQIFRYLTKPCPPPTLLAAFSAAAEQYRLVTTERVLLEQTLHGAIKTLTDVLALVSPTSFGRATRVKKLVSELADKLALKERWQVEVAAMLSQLGHITLPEETAGKAYFGGPLTEAERAQVARLPTLTDELLGHIPRLEVVRDILKSWPKAFAAPTAPLQPDAAVARRGAALLRIAVDFDALESGAAGGDEPAHTALAAMGKRDGQYDPEILAALVAVRSGANRLDVRDLSIDELKPGMVLYEDFKLATGALLVARGYEITERLLERVRNFPDARRKGAWRVVVPPAASP